MFGTTTTSTSGTMATVADSNDDDNDDDDDVDVDEEEKEEENNDVVGDVTARGEEARIAAFFSSIVSRGGREAGSGGGIWEFRRVCWTPALFRVLIVSRMSTASVFTVPTSWSSSSSCCCRYCVSDSNRGWFSTQTSRNREEILTLECVRMS